MIKYKQRKMNIENALYIRLLVTDDNCGPEQNDGLECVVIPQEDANKEHSAENASPPLSLPHHSTLSTTLATDLPSQPPKRHHLTIIPPTPSSENAGSRCDDECNICLNQFQVGDSVAWSIQYGKMVLPSAGSSGNMMCGGGSGTTMRDRFRICKNNCGDIPSSNDEYDVCKHVFHEACISRWLLVRDGCPTCRRSYFPSPAAVDNTFENETDLEQGFQNAQ